MRLNVTPPCSYSKCSGKGRVQLLPSAVQAEIILIAEITRGGGEGWPIRVYDSIIVVWKNVPFGQSVDIAVDNKLR
jgi:hypothetical protein